MNNDNWAVRVRRMKIEMRPGDNKVSIYFSIKREGGRGLSPCPEVREVKKFLYYYYKPF